MCIRDRHLEDYIGQEKVKQNLKIYLEAAKRRGEPMDHILLYGPPGLGKTCLLYTSLLANGFQVTVRLAVAFGVAALVVIVGISHVAGAAFAAHQGAALATEQLGGQQIAHILFCRRCV